MINLKSLIVTAAAFALSAALLFSGCTLAPDTAATDEPEVSAETGATEQASAAPEQETSAPTAAPTADASASQPLFGDFTAYDLDGNEIDSSVFTGHDVTMINVWATYCGPCLNEMPELGELAKEYADSGLQIIGIVVDAADGNGNAYDGAIDYAKSLVENTGANYLHILPSQTLTAKFLKDVYAVPTTVFVDENGVQLGEEYVGSKDKAGWKGVIDDMLKLSSNGAEG